eukprot:GGOE01004544.1.p1 GENE.GGOE01004544.1~~GGOE01004544.1.p1  ORF type:complete len:743 (-),score=201.65 GGOE01004544.1:1991-4114(-)
MEEEFEKSVRNISIAMCTNWCVSNGLYLTLGFVLHVLSCLNAKGIWEGGALTILILLLAIIFLLVTMNRAVHCIPSLRPYVAQVLCCTIIGVVTLTTVIVHAMIFSAANDAMTVHLPLISEAVNGNTPAHEELLQYITAELSKKYFMMHGIQLFFILFILQYVFYNGCVVALHLIVPAIPIIAVFISPIPSMARPVVILSLAPIVFSLFNCAHTMGLRRSNFRANYQLQAALAQEARALQKARDLEAAQKEASQKADSILNHILKNIMADAAGCVELFVGGAAESEALHQAADCLYRGMRWCKQRQTILRIASGSYSPVLASVSLQELGDSLVQGRRMSHRFLEGTFLLDSTLCGIVLDNAINNAFRHGHPENSEVNFTMSMASLSNTDTDDKRYRLTFEVTNRVAPHRPQVTPDLLRRVLSGQQEPSCHSPSSGTALSDHLGLRHMFVAADIHNMEVTLQQLGDYVVFEASLDAEMCCESSEIASTQEDADTMPSGLRIVCLDDSEVARKLLAHSLSLHLQGAIVEVFGESEADVDAFMEAALSGADIVVLDQNVSFCNITFLGTNLVQCLRRRGFTGYICIRSANNSLDDEAIYLASGAHCVLGKDLRPAELAARLQTEFGRHVHGKAKESLRSSLRLIDSVEKQKGTSQIDLDSCDITPQRSTTLSFATAPISTVSLPGVPEPSIIWDEQRVLIIDPNFASCLK